MEDNVLKTYYCCRFSKKTGKIDTSLSGLGKGMIQLWALQNTTSKAKDTIIFDEDGWVHSYYEGTGDFPEVTKYGEGTEEGVHHIDEFCVGLLEQCKKDAPPRDIPSTRA